MTRALWSVYLIPSITPSPSLPRLSSPSNPSNTFLCRTEQLMCLLIYSLSLILIVSFLPFPFFMYLSSIIFLPYERNAWVESFLCVHVYMCVYVRRTPCWVRNFLFVHGSKHLWPLQSRGDTCRETERLNKTRKDWEKRKKRGGRGEKQDDNKSSSDFTDAYFINHVNKSWWLCMAVAGRGDADYHTP